MDEKQLDIEKITLQKYGDDDFAFYCEQGDFSVRGTAEEVIENVGEYLKSFMK